MTFYRNKAFPVLSGLLWATFLFLDVTRIGDSTWIKFAGICLCCVTALLGAGTLDGKLVAAALCFTVAADWFLLVLDKHYTLGVALFLTVQGLYAYRLYLFRGKHASVPGFGFRILFFILLILCSAQLAYMAYGWRDGPPRYSVTQTLWSTFTSLLPLYYFINLCINTFEAFALKKTVFAWGLLLFVCCDVCVGAWNLNLLPGFTRVGMWLFYLPSQVLIVLSQEPETRSFHEKTV